MKSALNDLKSNRIEVSHGWESAKVDVKANKVQVLTKKVDSNIFKPKLDDIDETINEDTI